MRRGISTIRIKIPIPKGLKEKRDALNALPALKEDNQRSLYTDEQIQAQINHLCKNLSNDIDNTNVSDIPACSSSLIDYLAPKKGYPYLPLYFLKNNHNIPIPYEKLSQSSTDVVARLSVTKIIPFSYCELKKMYELYNGDVMKETEVMKMGSTVHRDLEVSVHPQKYITLQNKSSNTIIEVDSYSDDDLLQNYATSPKSTTDSKPALDSETNILDPKSSKKQNLESIDGKENFVDTTDSLGTEIVEDEQFEKVKSEIDINETTKIHQTPEILLGSTSSNVIYTDSTDLEKMQHYKLIETIKRIIELLVHGRCREVLTHGYFSPNSSSLVSLPTSDSIVISGIIDDLKITSDYAGAFDKYKEDLCSHLHNAVDFDSVIRIIRDVSTNWTDSVNSMLYIIVNDDKTRMYRKKPVTSVNKTNMLQVGIYRRLLGLQASDPANSFLSWCRNMEDRQLDLIKPMENDIVTLCCMVNNMYLHDCLKLKNGEPLDFDSIQFKPSPEPYIFHNASNDPKLDILNGEWKFSPNLAHICARLAQVQSLLMPFLHENLQVTYLTQDRELIAKIDGKYDEGFVDNQIDLGMKLWLGKREPVPTNTTYLCDRCEFKNFCQIPLKRAGSV